MFALHFFQLLHKNNVKMQQFYLPQNYHGLEQQIYAKQKKFTQPLVVMVETFRRSDGIGTTKKILLIGNLKRRGAESGLQ